MSVINPDRRARWAFLDWKVTSTDCLKILFVRCTSCLLAVALGEGLGWVSRQVSLCNCRRKGYQVGLCVSFWRFFECRNTITSCFSASYKAKLVARLPCRSLSTRTFMFRIVCWSGLNKPVFDTSSTVHYW